MQPLYFPFCHIHFSAEKVSASFIFTLAGNNIVNFQIVSISAEYPFINYYVIRQPSQRDCNELFKQIRSHVYETAVTSPAACALNAAAAATPPGKKVDMTIDLFDEMATIARPPVETLSKKPITEKTGYIVCLYKVFRGDDGEKFERNWLFWTGK
jgi:hypothetical protein